MTAIAATPEQQAAIATQGHALVIEAGAGTGKTWVLVRRFLYLLDSHRDWPLESVVAITFTEKAAREMRSRIRAAIEARAQDPTAPPHWQARRRDLERLQVSTIHSLCARLLRENAIAAGVDPRFEVLDEREAELLQEEAITRTLRALAQSNDPALDLLAGLRVRDLREELAALLAQRGTVGPLFDDLDDPQTLLSRWRDGVAQMQAALWAQAQRDEPRLREASDFFATLEIRDPADKLAPAVEWARAGCDHVAAGDIAEAARCWAQIDRRGGKQANWGGKAGKAELSEWLGLVQAFGKEMLKKGYADPVGPDDERAAATLQRWGALWRRLVETYDAMKQERHALDFDDLERLTLELLARDRPDPRLRAFLNGIHHLMVDEFQDTNVAQQRIVFVLAPPSSGQLFVVGDAKQSIYRFRQAQVAVFNATAARISREGQAPLPLSDSFRAHERLVAALNSAFDRLLQPLGATHEAWEARPGPLRAHRDSHTDHVAPVELWLLPKTSAEGETIDAETARLWEASLLAERLHDLHDAAFPVWDKNEARYRPFRYGDAAILFRATTVLPLYEERFKAAGLPYLTVGGRGYFDRPEVRDLVALLAALHRPSDDLSLATALRSPLFNLSDETLFRLRWQDASGESRAAPCPFRDALLDPPPTDQPDEVMRAGATLHTLWPRVGRVEVWALLHAALARTGYLAALALADATLGGRRRGNAEKFLELAREQGGASLSDFLRRVRHLQARAAREGEALASAPETGAVQVMSIHAAKGLEFPVVVVADLGRGSRGGWGSPRVLADPAFGLVCQWRDAGGDWQTPASYRWAQWLGDRMEAAENRRLLYVACTRAADRLILSGRVGQRGSWLSDLLDVWALSADGAAEEVVGRQGFALQVRRPDEPPRHGRPRPQPLSAEGSGVADEPPLVQPLPVALPPPSTWAETEALRPAVGASGGRADPHRAPGYLVDRLVRRTLAEWERLSQSDEALQHWLAATAHRVGVPALAQPHAVREGLARLKRLRASPLVARLRHAAQRHAALPFTLATPAGPQHGTIDLLWEENGAWYLLAWETGWVNDLDVAACVAGWQPTLALHAEAARQVLGALPRVGVGLLAPRVRVVWVDETGGEGTVPSHQRVERA